jgi:hypothetical protein
VDPKLSDKHFEAIVGSVPREHQIDGYCILTGRVGYRVSEEDGKSVIDLVAGTVLDDRDYGDGALAAFLLISISVMNGIMLGPQEFFHYLKFLPRLPS